MTETETQGLSLSFFLPTSEEHVADPGFLAFKRLEGRLESALPNKYRTKYAMVCYSYNPYHVVEKVAVFQRELLQSMIDEAGGEEKVDLAKAEAILDEKLKPRYDELEISLDF